MTARRKASVLRPRARAKSGPPGLSNAVRLITPGGAIELPWPKPGTEEIAKVQEQAMHWTHVVRNRGRWIGTPSLAEQQDIKARALLKLLGVSDAERKKIADAGSVSVSIPYAREETGWEARILPWEFILSAGTRDLRTGPLLVERSLVCGPVRGPAAYRKVLFVESAPGRLSQDWDFEDERRLVKRYTKAQKFERLVSPTRLELARVVKRFRPDIVHLAGFDTHQGLELVQDSRAEGAIDGYLLAEGAAVAPVPAVALAATLTTPDFAPSLVFCNIWNSAARIAPLLVAAGASAAIGFQDGMDDALAEIFLGNFYRALTETRDIDIAFQEAWQSMQLQPKPLRGSGIVLWHRGGPAGSITAKPTTARVRDQQVLSPEKVTGDVARGQLLVTVEPEPQFSYGLLHNNRDLFRRFLIRNLSDRRILGLDVFVELHSNEGTYPYRQTFSLDGTVLDLSRHIRIALTSHLARTLDEVLHTSLYVVVKWGNHEIFRQTFPVTMAPVDQWTDTDTDRIFLPSFVFPRDHAVGDIIRNAEHFMTALRDDPTAGFDGYQAIDADLPNPTQHVDSQVQALWYSVVYRVPASYINPPPTYAVASQRIRTPSEIVGGGFGTCIDLALLMASCLEAIEIYPVIFVLEDHAFPGYWRTDTARESFCRRIASAASNVGSASSAIHGDSGSAKGRPGAAWCFDAGALPDIQRAIRLHHLVPLESVGLTGRSSLATAVSDAQSYFHKDEESRFLLMLDVQTARERGVTPLPLGPRLQRRS